MSEDKIYMEILICIIRLVSFRSVSDHYDMSRLADYRLDAFKLCTMHHLIDQNSIYVVIPNVDGNVICFCTSFVVNNKHL